jgi:hypothetical protein
VSGVCGWGVDDFVCYVSSATNGQKQRDSHASKTTLKPCVVKLHGLSVHNEPC